MNCQEIQKELSAYLDGEVGDGLRAEMEAHLVGCPQCRQQLAGLRRVAAGVTALPKLTPAPQFLSEVRRKLASGEPAPKPDWVDLMFRPVWLKVPLEALAMIAVTAGVLVMQRPPPRQEFAAKRSEQNFDRAPKARILMESAEIERLEARGAAPVLAGDARNEAQPVLPRETGTAVATDLTAAKTEAAKDKLYYNLPAPPQVAPATPPSVASLPPETNAPVAVTKPTIAPIIIVHAGDFTKVRREVETAAVRMGGQVLSRTESQLTGKGGVVYTFQVQLPPGQVAAFRSQFATAGVGGQARSLMGTPAVAQGGLPATVTATAAQAEIADGSITAAKERVGPVVVEVQVVPAK